MGDPLLREGPNILAKGCFGLGGPMTGICGSLVSCCGDSTKHSSRDIDDIVDTGCSLPNWKGGSWFCGPLDLKDNAFVE